MGYLVNGITLDGCQLVHKLKGSRIVLARIPVAIYILATNDAGWPLAS